MNSGDFNNDVNIDVITNDSFGSDVLIFLGNGDGSFNEPILLPVGKGNRAIEVGLFNGDKFLDLAITNQNNNNVSIYFGSATGFFSIDRKYDTGDFPSILKISDLNNDQILDLIIGNLDPFGAGGGNKDISILLGIGNGSFSESRHFPAGNRAQDIAIIDFNLDGTNDLIVANEGSSSGKSNTVLEDVSVLLGDGEGIFSPPTHFTSGNAPTSLTLSDISGDSILDAIVVHSFDSNVVMLEGDSNGGFGNVSTLFQLNGKIRTIKSDDLNNDNKDDLIILVDSDNGPDELIVLLAQ